MLNHVPGSCVTCKCLHHLWGCTPDKCNRPTKEEFVHLGQGLAATLSDEVSQEELDDLNNLIRANLREVSNAS